MNYLFNLRIIKFVHEDILKLYARFGYNEFIKSDTQDIELRYSIKKLLNEAVISKIGKSRDGRIRYKLTKFVVENCQEFEARHSNDS